MAKTAKNILSLSHEEAMEFFMKSEQYHGFELPEYFTFDEVLKDMDEKRAIIDLVYHKLCNQPNSSYNQLWLQNMTYTQDKKQGISPYTIRLCQLVAGKAVDTLWNNNWLKPELATSLPYDSVVDGEALKKVTPVITFRETRAYYDVLLDSPE